MPFECTDLVTLVQEFPELPVLILYLIWWGFEVEGTNTQNQHLLALKD